MTDFSPEVARRATMTIHELRAEVNRRIADGSMPPLPADPKARQKALQNAILEVLNDRYEEEEFIEAEVSKST